MIAAAPGGFPELEKLRECLNRQTPSATVQTVWIALHRLDRATVEYIGSRTFRDGTNGYMRELGSPVSLTRGDVDAAVRFLDARGLLPNWVAPMRTNGKGPAHAIG